MARMITGIVSSKKTDKTIVVTEHVRLTHPLYRKQYTVTKRFMAHDEKNEAKEGDKVVIVETRPISARKHFTLKSIVQKARVQHVESENVLDEYVENKPGDDDASKLVASSKDNPKKATAKTEESAAEKQSTDFEAPEPEESE